MEYSKKIKELKSSLSEKTQKQSHLIKEITNLRNCFKEHQEEIMKINEELTI
jgi:molecular chaperone GrpE (heat shock protein)